MHYKPLLSSAPWHVGQLFEDVNDQAYLWNALMNNILDEVAPLKKMREREKDVPYMTNQWKSAIRAKRKANDKYLRKKRQKTGNFDAKLGTRPANKEE